jgi:hypothetical protein
MKSSPRAFNPWPLGIALVLGLFFIAMLVLIVTARFNRNQLVASDYYDQEMRYQTRIDQLRSAEAFGGEVAVNVEPSVGRVRVSVPAAEVAKGLRGAIQLYRPSNPDWDRQIPLKPDVQGTQWVDLSELSSGLWKVRLEWTSESGSYFAERELKVPRREE